MSSRHGRAEWTVGREGSGTLTRERRGPVAVDSGRTFPSSLPRPLGLSGSTSPNLPATKNVASCCRSPQRLHWKNLCALDERGGPSNASTERESRSPRGAPVRNPAIRPATLGSPARTQAARGRYRPHPP